MKTVFWLVVALSSVWVLYDAIKIRVTKGNKKGLAPVAWLLLCLFFWNLAFPIYLIKRRPVKIWKTIPIVVFFWVFPMFTITTINFLRMQNRAKLALENKQSEYSEYNIGDLPNDSMEEWSIGDTILKTGTTEDEVIKILGTPLKIDSLKFEEKGTGVITYCFIWFYEFNIKGELVGGVVFMENSKVSAVVYPIEIKEER